MGKLPETVGTFLVAWISGVAWLLLCLAIVAFMFVVFHVYRVTGWFDRQRVLIRPAAVGPTWGGRRGGWNIYAALQPSRRHHP